MLFSLGDLLIELQADRELEQAYAALLDGWPSPQKGSAAVRPCGSDPRKPDILLGLSLIHELRPPAERPVFVDLAYNPEPTVGRLSVYRSDQAITIVFEDCARITLTGDVLAVDGPVTVQGVATSALWQSGRLEDVLFTGLAPLLRRRGYYLLHAFAAVRENRAVLLVGPSGSGKTTAGLSLVQQGWGFLANDVVLLQERGLEIYALPTPNGISLSERTVRLVPGLAGLFKSTDNWRQKKRYFAASHIISEWGEGAPVKTIIFPEVGQERYGPLTSMAAAVCLARLMESSLDRWDQDSVPAHIDLLTLLCRQASIFDLSLGPDLGYLPSSLGVTW